MPKHPHPSRQPANPASSRPANRTWTWFAIFGLAIVSIIGLVVLLNRPSKISPSTNTALRYASIPPDTNVTPSMVTASPPAELPQMPIKQAVMVTVELDFGPVVPSVADALRQIERRHQPTDGVGRVFSILDAYGEPTPDGRKLHLSMHVSTEKAGVGSLIFRRTGEVLWSNRIVPAADGSTTASAAGLTILLADGVGGVATVDGSSNPASILEATLKEPGVPIAQAWPDGVEREVTFIYSACGCPVKVMCRRIGDRTVRTKEMPVLFPDDPAAVSIITKLMRW